ncbi:MAG: HNH endonuclease [Acidobacteriota bacterium]
MTPRKLWIGVTDDSWFEFLSSRRDLDELNFWLPMGSRPFKVLQRGEPFLFKLHSPNNYIVGGGYFEKATHLPVDLAWEVFGQKNGARSREEMRARIEKYRKSRGVGTGPHESYEIGCLILLAPFFFERRDWIPVPPSWSPNLVTGKSFSTDEPEGKSLWEAIQQRLVGSEIREGVTVYEDSDMYGEPTLVYPRLGQGTFRVLITDAYSRRCAATGEKALPVLEAAHIKPVSRGGIHRIDNGILLRSDLHRLFDLGYLGVAPDLTLHVSSRLRSEFGNGEIYYPLEGKPLSVPTQSELRPNPELLAWHTETVFRA